MKTRKTATTTITLKVLKDRERRRIFACKKIAEEARRAELQRRYRQLCGIK